MKKTICFSDLVLLAADPFESVAKLIEAGADHVELMMDGPAWDKMEHLFEKYAEKFISFPIGYTIHPPAWDINITSENKAIREASMDQYIKAIQFAGLINAKHVVIHPGFCFSPVFSKETAKQRAKAMINELCQVAKPLGVKLGIENVGYNGGSIFTQEEYTEFLKTMDETAGYLIDIGHANLNNWDIPKLIHDVNDRLIAVHIHDNHGSGDEHLAIGKGTIAWQPIYQELRKVQECQFILEYAPETTLDQLKEGKSLIEKNVLLHNESETT